MIGLSWEQVDVLWSCLVCDFCCSDEALDWFVQQARSKDLHALDVDTLKYIFAEKVGFNCQQGSEAAKMTKGRRGSAR